MAGEWSTAALEELVDDILDRRGVTPLKLGSDFTSAGHRVISAKLMKESRLDLSADEPRFVDATTYKRWMQSPLLADDVILTSEAPLGEIAYIKEQLDWCLGQRLFGIRTNKSKLFGRFLFYALKSEPVFNDLTSRATGTTVQGIRQSELRRVQIPVPPLAEQKAIAAVLGALDDKIELNRRMNATLEAMARALFQSWFVDFDPVRAKLDGRKPIGLDETTAALFPDSFEDSELGHIPKGWNVRTLSDLTSLITKGTTPTQDDVAGAPDPDAQINYVRVNSIDEDGSVLADKLTTIPESVHAGVLKRSILMANDVLYTIAGTIGRIALAEEWILPANTNQAVAIIRPEPEIPSGFLILTMRHEVFREELHNNIVQAVQANLSLGMLSKARVVVPPQSILQQLFRPIDALLSQISANRAQSRTLATLRDTLLPKLLSGELQVADVASKAATHL
jgi:type I restriction enzyme S subunit